MWRLDRKDKGKISASSMSKWMDVIFGPKNKWMCEKTTGLLQGNQCRVLMFGSILCLMEVMERIL
jgi:hypothetical protein